MIEKDFILKLIEQFFLSIEKWLHKPKEEQLALFQDFKKEMYQTFLKQEASFFDGKNYEKTIGYFENTYENQEERLARIEILSELLYLEVEEHCANKDFLEKVLALFSYTNKQSKTFSITRANQMDHIQKLLETIA